MRGLYEGIEEAAFQPTAGGYVFQMKNPWFFGSSQHFLVNESQKARLAECLRATTQRIKPFVFASAIAIPLLLALGIFAFAFTGGTLTVTEVLGTGESTSYSQWLRPNGATVVVSDHPLNKSDQLFSLAVRVSGLPGDTATATVTKPAGKDKPAATYVIAFGPAGVTVNFTDGDGRVTKFAKLTGKRGTPADVTAVFALILSFALFAPYYAAVHLYSLKRLRPLVAGVPRTSERITIGQSTARFATQASNKLFIVMGVGVTSAVLGNATALIAALASHRSSEMLPLIVGVGATSFSAAGFAYLTIARFRHRGRQP
jgi:hypothetical protein